MFDYEWTSQNFLAFDFAGALAEIGLPHDSIPMALLFFNLGIELGQLLFVVLSLALIAKFRAILRYTKVSLPTWGRAVPAYAIGSLAVFWVIDRVASFWAV